MKKYKVKFGKSEEVEVEAINEWHAEDLAVQFCNDNNINISDMDEVDIVEEKEIKYKYGILNVNLEYRFPDTMSDSEIEERLLEVELPKEYVEDSADFLKIVRE